MYSTCMFCHSSLGANEAIEHFPVGRRLAFDADKGRLWVICGACARWNLSPLDERWEAIEECEKAFRDTRLRVSTDHIGLARLKEGLELVRVGNPQRPEMAAWRYGDQFGGRRRRHLITLGLVGAGAAGYLIAGPVMGYIATGGFGLFNAVGQAHSLYHRKRVRARITIPDLGEKPRVIRSAQLSQLRLEPVGTDDFKMRVAYESDDKYSLMSHRDTFRFIDAKSPIVELTGDEAIRMAAKLLPVVNSKGGKARDVQSAVGVLESAPDPRAVFARVARPGGDWPVGAPNVMSLPIELRLALEMASNEESERRALEGELSVLEAAWKEAEEIAAISDDLLLPDKIRKMFAR
ncbi:MAG: hypothetical protein JWO05_700 [Gemmatimonadetes bacterium]|nr:hypothetical protein [Gemmatimonadota bacterium]